MFRWKHRDVPELNTTSTADISFMRKLAPLDEQQQEQRDINRSNVLQVKIDEHDVLYCDDKVVTHEELQQQVESFVASHQTDQHVIAVETSRTTSYNAYFEMQNAVVRAYRSLREKMARQQYGHSYAQCSDTERDAIKARYPQRISEGVK